MSVPMPRSERELHWTPVVTVLPYLLLGLLMIGKVIVEHDDVPSLLVDLALCALIAVWLLVMFTLRPAWRGRTAPMVVFITGLVIIWAVLVIRSPLFGCYAPAVYVLAFRVLPWPWELPGVGVVAAVAGTAQASTLDKSTTAGLLGYFAVVVANVIPMCGFALWAWGQSKNEYERDQALEDVSAANRRLEATLAENAGLHQQLLAQAREAGVLDERQRMAREIHDTLAQGLTGIITQLQATDPADGTRSRRHIEAAIRLARESLNEARRSVHALRPEPLDTARLSDALADVARRWSALHGIEVQVATTGTARPLPPEAEVVLFRTAQEALANVAKHAQASRVGLTLSYLESEVALDVRDDGKGFQPGRVNGSGGFGLIAMRQRVEGLSGTLELESEPGAGTAVSAAIPIATRTTQVGAPA